MYAEEGTKRMATSPTVRSESSEISGRNWAERVRSSRGLETASRISVVMIVLNLAAASVLISGGFKRKEGYDRQ
jgi:hypothetical protein